MPLRREGIKTRNFSEKRVFSWFSGVHKNGKVCNSMCWMLFKPGELDTAAETPLGGVTPWAWDRPVGCGYPGNGVMVATVRTTVVPHVHPPGTLSVVLQWAFAVLQWAFAVFSVFYRDFIDFPGFHRFSWNFIDFLEFSWNFIDFHEFIDFLESLVDQKVHVVDQECGLISSCLKSATDFRF